MGCFAGYWQVFGGNAFNQISFAALLWRFYPFCQKNSNLYHSVLRCVEGKYTHTTCVFWFGKTFPFSGKFNFIFLSSELESQERLESIQASLRVFTLNMSENVELSRPCKVYSVQLYTMRQCKTHVHVMVLYNFEVKGKGIQRIKEHSGEWLVFVCNDSFYPFILILISPIHVHILMEFSWHIAICDVSQKPGRIWWYLRHVKCALNWLKRSYKSCI